MFNPPKLKTWINGKPEISEKEDKLLLRNPNNGEVLQQSRSSSPEQVERALKTATLAHQDARWHSKSVLERADTLDNFANELLKEEQNIALADALNSGVPISVTKGFAAGLPEIVRDVANRIRSRGDFVIVEDSPRKIIKQRIPWGPAALILPWNAPSFMIVKKLAYALAAGATTVIKPSSFSPWSAQYVMQAAHRAGFPQGVINLVTGSGSLGRTIVSDTRVRTISMTGSTQTGKQIASSAGANLTRLQLELGSNNPAIVREDANLQLTADELIKGAVKLSGQWCEAPRRVYAQRNIYEELMKHLKEKLVSQKVGSSLDDSTDIGPVAYSERKIELENQLQNLIAQGATVIRTQIPQLPESSFFAPTIAYGENLELEEEIFGPILTITPYNDEANAIQLANSGAHGLAGYVFTENLEAGRKMALQIEAGEVKINGTSALDMADDSEQGFFANSGIGGHGDAYVLEFFTGWRIVGTDAEGLPI